MDLRARGLKEKGGLSIAKEKEPVIRDLQERVIERKEGTKYTFTFLVLENDPRTLDFRAGRDKKGHHGIVLGFHSLTAEGCDTLAAMFAHAANEIGRED